MVADKKSVFDEVSKMSVYNLLQKELKEIYEFEIRFIQEENEAFRLYRQAKRSYERAKLGSHWIAGIKREKIRKEGIINGK